MIVRQLFDAIHGVKMMPDVAWDKHNTEQLIPCLASLFYAMSGVKKQPHFHSKFRHLEASVVLLLTASKCVSLFYV